VSDAWAPQVNGVVRTLSTVSALLPRGGDTVEVIGPDRFRTVPAPSYPEIRLAVRPRAALARMADAFAPTAVHVATEGPLGWAMRAVCRARGWPFTTSFHTKFPEYLHARTGIPPRLAWAVLRRFHESGAGTFAATPSLREELARRGFTKVRPWTRGVDLDLFRPEPRDPWEGLARPVFLYAGRVAVEKNIEAFLRSTCPAPRWWWATARSGRRCKRASRRRISPAGGRARRSRRPTPAPTFPCSLRAPTPSGW
jgi:glycosyltransferase involved in cell wall biosynthesis